MSRHDPPWERRVSDPGAKAPPPPPPPPPRSQGHIDQPYANPPVRESLATAWNLWAQFRMGRLDALPTHFAMHPATWAQVVASKDEHFALADARNVEERKLFGVPVRFDQSLADGVVRLAVELQAPLRAMNPGRQA